MAPPPYMVTSECGEEPISRTYQYRKVMKPMLERKRRARINRCLDELKELMISAIQSEGENVSKLEKADILELTVRHLRNLKEEHQLILTQEQSYTDRFRAGFTQCAQEVTHFVTRSSPNDTAGRKLLQHLSACVRQLDNVTQNIHLQEQDQHHRIQQPYIQHSLTPPISPRTEPIVREHKDPHEPMWRPW